jgi:hypothetical protein
VKSKLSLGSRRQALLLGALALVLVLAVVKWRPGGAAAPLPTAANSTSNAPGASRAGAGPASGEDDAPAPAPRSGGRRSSSREVSADEVPVLNTKDFDPPRSIAADTGRDLFRIPEPTRPVVPTPTPRPPMPGEGAFVGPLPPPPPTPTPKPPEVTFKFLGSFGPKEHPIAVIQQGDEVFNARAGDTLFGKFVLRKVGYESIDVGFVGFAATETKRLPVAP